MSKLDTRLVQALPIWRMDLEYAKSGEHSELRLEDLQGRRCAVLVIHTGDLSALRSAVLDAGQIHPGAGFACSSRPVLHPGDQIARDIDLNSNEQHGTIGLIVTRTAGNSAQRYLLTNSHVIQQLTTAEANGNIYKPYKTTCNHPVATTLAGPQDRAYTLNYSYPPFPGIPFKVDAALASVNAGSGSGNVNPDVANKISKFGPALRDLLTELPIASVSSPQEARALNAKVAALNIEVVKYGATTGFARGLVIGVCEPVRANAKASPTDPDFLFQITIKPHPSEPSTKTQFTVNTSEIQDILDAFDPIISFYPPSVAVTQGAVSGEHQKIELSGPIFCDHGDFGAAVLDMNGNIVGLLNYVWAFEAGDQQSLNLGLGSAQFIMPAFNALGLLPTSVLPPGAPQSGMALAETSPMTAPVQQDFFEAIETQIGESAEARRLLQLARIHLPELQQVLHHRRRAMVSWHRNKGPAFLTAFARAARHPGRGVPAEIEGVGLGTGLRRLHNVLSLEGSAALREALAEHGDWLVELLERATNPANALRLLLGEAATTAPPCLHIVNARGVPGTVGALLRSADGMLRCLTSHHVLFGDGAGTGDTVFAILDRDGHRHMSAIGRTEGGHIGVIMRAGQPVFVDCALLGLIGPENWPAELRQILASLPVIHEITGPEIGAEVSKSGAATGRTTGRLVDVAYPDLPFIHGRQFDAPGQLLIRPLRAAGLPPDMEINFCAQGDSGAPVFDARGRIVGLLWGANARGDGIACPIRPVLCALGVAPEAATEDSAPMLVARP